MAGGDNVDSAGDWLPQVVQLPGPPAKPAQPARQQLPVLANSVTEESGGHSGRQRSASSQRSFGGAPRANSEQFHGRYDRHAGGL